MLELVGTFRVAPRRAVVEHCFDGHPYAASRTLPELVREGLVAVHVVPVGTKGYQVLSLTDAGRDHAAFGARRRRRKPDHDEDPNPQRFWAGLPDMRNLQHDADVFEAVMQDTEDVRRKGGRIRRVRLEPELRGLLAAAGETARRTGGAAGAGRARREAAASIGLRVCEEGAPLPDALVELEAADGSRSVRGIDVVTGSYTHAQVRAKQQAGFRLYSSVRFASDRDRRRYRRLNVEELWPLSWGSAR